MKKPAYKLRTFALNAVNRVLDLTTGGRRRPVFMDIDETFPSLRKLDARYEEIRDELLTILPDKARLPRYHELDAGQTPISAGTPADWKVFMLYAMGDKPDANRTRCPKTTAALDQIPGLFQAFFSILDAGKHVPAHCGPYRGYIRYHLGLVVPANNPPSIRVKDTTYVWEEGRSVLFDDSWDHEVINNSDGIRVVLIVDVLRPMPQPFDGLNRIVAFIIRQLYGKGLTRKLAAFQ